MKISLAMKSRGGFSGLWMNANNKNCTHVIYNLCQFVINLTVVNVDWKEVWYNALKRNWTITYFTLVLNNFFCFLMRIFES
jgi:hypothetical protein